MRYSEILNESVSADAVHYYMTEACGIFAYALWLAYDKPIDGRIGIISNRDGEKWSRSIPYEVTHAFFLLENNGEGVDVKGVRPIWKIAKDFGNSYFHSQHHPDEFKKKFMGNGNKPLYGGLSEIREALEIIQSNKDYFGLGKRF